jgi:hypothetical protein
MTDAMGIVEKIALMGRDAATEAGWPQGFIDAALELHGSDGSANPHTPPLPYPLGTDPTTWS